MSFSWGHNPYTFYQSSFRMRGKCWNKIQNYPSQYFAYKKLFHYKILLHIKFKCNSSINWSYFHVRIYPQVSEVWILMLMTQISKRRSFQKKCKFSHVNSFWWLKKKERKKKLMKSGTCKSIFKNKILIVYFRIEWNISYNVALNTCKVCTHL